MYSKEELSEIIENYILGLVFPTEPDSLYKPISYSLESGGKRIRPLLTMMTCNAFSDNISAALPCAAAVEVFHNFTLLHDDIMDNAAVRRGRPAVHRRWGVNSAILSGDAMMIYAYRILEKISPELLPRIFAVFNDTSLKVCEGQQYDMDYESRESVGMNEYLGMISLKTAVLLAGAAVMGAIAGGASEDDCRRIYNFAMETGMAFQIQDDILDSYGTQETLGKKIGGDILEGKKTFLTTAAIENANEDTRMRLAGLTHNKEMIPAEKIARVKAIYDSLGVREKAEKAVAEHTAKAIAALDEVTASSERLELLRGLALSLTKRIH